MRHAEPSREDFPVKAGFLPNATARLVDRSFAATAHVLGLQFFGGDKRTALHQGRGLLVQEIAPDIADALMQPADLLGESAVAVRTAFFPCALSLQIGQRRQRLAHPARVVDLAAVIEISPVAHAQVEADLITARALAITGLIGNP